MRRNVPVVIARFLAAAWLLAPAAGRGGVTHSLATDFVEVLVEGVPRASRYVLEAKPVVVVNQSDMPMRIRFDAEVPQPAEMRAGYDPIPDAAWVGFEPRVFDLKPGEKAVGKAVLYVPSDSALAGRRFQVMLQLHADAGGGSPLAIGLKPRLMFSVADRGAAEPPRVVNAPPPLAWIKPFSAAATEGRMTFTAEPLTAENYWPEELSYEAVADRDALAHADLRPGETPLPDPSWVEISPGTLVLPAYGRSTIAVTVRLPIAAEHFGRTYVVALRTVARRASHPPVSTYNVVRVVVPALGPHRD